MTTRQVATLAQAAALAFLGGCAGLHRSHFGPSDVDSISTQMAELAGTYQCGSQGFWHDTLILAEDGCFERTYRSCIREWSLAGRAHLTEGELVLEADWDLDTWFDAPSNPAAFNVLRWGARTYLVHEDQLRRFCWSVSHGVEPRVAWHGDALLRADDWRLRPTGLPSLDPAWLKQIDSVTRIGVVTETLDSGMAWVDLGSSHGIAPSEVLTLMDVPKSRDAAVERGFGPLMVEAPLELLEIDEGRCKVRLSPGQSESGIAVGMRVRTSPRPLH